MPRIKPVLAWLLLLLTAAGCSNSQSQPAVPEASGSTADAWAGAALPVEAGCLRTATSRQHARLTVGNKRHFVESGFCTAEIGQGEAEVQFVLPVKIDMDSLDRYLRIEADPTPSIALTGDQASGTEVYLRFAAGQPGQQITVEYTDPNGTDGRFGFRIKRNPNPQVQTEVQAGTGNWQPVDGLAIVPKGPLTLRFTVTGPVDPAQVRKRIGETLAGAKAEITQPAPGQIIVSLAQPPVRMDFHFQGMENSEHLESGCTIFAGQEPVLVAYDPVTGKEEPLGKAPLDAGHAEQSPDGRWAVVWATAPGNPLYRQAWVADLATGRFQQAPFRADPMEGTTVWIRDSLFLLGRERFVTFSPATGKGEERKIPAMQWRAPSPDGRYLVGYSSPLWGGAENVVPATVRLVDTETLQWRTFSKVARIALPGKEQYPPLHVGWTSDSKTLIMQDLLAWGGPAQFVAIDIDSGKVSPHPGPVPPSPGYPDRSTGPKGWSYAMRSWGTVVVSDPGGKTQEIGVGLAVGWRADGRLLIIRWSDAQYRVEATRPI